MKLNKLIIEGEKYRRTIIFENGLTVITGDRTSGKSLILNLIDYCLGKNKKINLNVQQELRTYCDVVYLEIKIDNNIFTVQRNLETDISKIGVFFSDFENKFNFVPQVLTIKEYMQFLLDQLGIDNYYLEKSKSKSKEETLENLSFRDIMKFVYIKQHNFGTPDFLDKGFSKYKITPTFKLINMLLQPNLYDVEQEIIRNKNRKVTLEDELKGLKSYLKDKEAEDHVYLKERLEDNQNLLLEENIKKQNLLKNINEKQTVKNELFSKLKEKTMNQVIKIAEIDKEIENLNFQKFSKQELINEYNFELTEFYATKEALFKTTIENHFYNCPLCNSELKEISKPDEGIINIDKAIIQLQDKIKVINRLVEEDSFHIYSLINKKKGILEEKSILDNAINEFSKNIEVPYLSEIETINSLINSHNKNINIINELIKIHNKVSEKLRLIDSIRDKLIELESKKDSTKIDIEHETKVYEFLNLNYIDLLNKFGYSTNILSDYISKDNGLPYYKSEKVFEQTSGGLLVCIQLAYLGSIILKKIDDPSLNHPGFFIIDSLSKYLGVNNQNENNENIIDPITYNEIYKFMIRLSKNYQIIIVDNTPTEIANPYIKYTFYSGDKGLIDLNKNEMENQ